MKYLLCVSRKYSRTNFWWRSNSWDFFFFFLAATSWKPGAAAVATCFCFPPLCRPGTSTWSLRRAPHGIPLLIRGTRIAFWSSENLFSKNCTGCEVIAFPFIQAWVTPDVTGTAKPHVPVRGGTSWPETSGGTSLSFHYPWRTTIFWEQPTPTWKVPISSSKQQKKKINPKKQKSKKIRLLSPLCRGWGRFPLALYRGPRLGRLPKTPVCFPDRKYESK